ncbi:MAG: LLM class flavin-dependent oxidoreductase [Chloroflexi bacterium]|nr:LLM class flavin-dependent oxidoreductase [Chloroflexota bacterium]
MRVGLGFDGSWLPLRAAIELARRAERAGYESVWVAEDLFTGRDAFSPLGAIAMVTERVGLGTCIVPVHHSRHLHVLASSAAAIDEISSGRFILGLGAGLGWPSYPEDARPLLMMREAIDGTRALLAGETFECQGKKLKLQGTFSWDVLPQVRPRIPIYVGARGPKMTQLTGELADGIILELWVAPTEIAERRYHLERGARRAGRDPAELEMACLVHIFASADGQIDDCVRTHLAHWLARRVSDEVAAGAGLDLEAVAAVRAAVAREGRWSAASLVTRPMVDAFCAAGTPEQCLAKLREYRQAGVTLPILFPFGGDANLALEIGAEFARESAEVPIPKVPVPRVPIPKTGRNG